MDDVLGLHVPKQVKQTAGSRHVEAVATKFGDPPFLVGDVLLAQGNTPVGLLQELDYGLAIYHLGRTDWRPIGSTRREPRTEIADGARPCRLCSHLDTRAATA